MLSKHPEGCRYPHGHTRRIEIVCSSPTLNTNDMVVDFKALKMAIKAFIEMFDHSMAINSNDPARPELEARYPEGLVIYEDQDPTTEVIAADVFAFVEEVFQKGWKGTSKSGVTYTIPAGKVRLERVRVWETETSWAEYSGS